MYQYLEMYDIWNSYLLTKQKNEFEVNQYIIFIYLKSLNF